MNMVPASISIDTGPSERRSSVSLSEREFEGQARPDAGLAGAGMRAEQPTRLMSLLGISFDGRVYRYKSFRYDRFEDAVGYAQIVAARGAEEDDEEQGEASQAREADPMLPPTAEDLELMNALSISFDRGIFHYEGFRYERLRDAVNYAHLVRARASRVTRV
ncbi:hypothetical protein OOT46_13680 [Aquabacterium sp. A7-Y]|uniref:hypothetical protein n=1 Tax=Aquabacterium sp. A7-Y TaxID=1349605 RepID=UPI00223CC170|nr:hypothetical protein [Aquabacterium sp. A7-Y]MCW7538891.1 hypothetical protein [Aquabacterium sp. A7-Y]